ncbi:MAG: uroporphyrinogen decarboxylase family protein [Armatimonadota bacterium]|nr:uroporphyrinogen decarboxylase family protein [Armatimonadota bacterium]
MTSRERVLTTLAHKEPDRVPIDFGGMRSTGIMAIAYNKLKAYLGITGGETRVYDTMQQLALPEPPILERFHVDVIDLNNTLGRFEEEWKDWTLPDGSPAKVPVDFNPIREGDCLVVKDSLGRVQMRMPDGCLYFEPCFNPLADAHTFADVDRLFEMKPVEPKDLLRMQERAKWLYENTDYAIMLGFGGNILEGGQNAFGWERFMTEIALNTALVEYALDKMVEVYMENLQIYLEMLGGYIQLIQMGDDLGTQIATMLSPDLYRRVVKPRHAKQYWYVREHSDVHVFLHACGSCWEIMGDLVEEGVEVLNPVQTSAAGMDPRRLKKEFGDKLTFWGGGCDTQSVLPNATPEEIERHVKERIEIFAPGGGFVFTQIHNVQANVPPQNVVACYDAAWRYGEYPIGSID